ncbi:hypothetical protein NDU88_005103 [Pleurodeles waltl]|uniref:Secreted protein n=1 Tax=Pleurodeles waltl TaxID=8319 RepID=A0AAV7NRA0_PLEWA|nr:hypothetical protein NDU88_005103 [Pleurodeles waltl]
MTLLVFQLCARARPSLLHLSVWRLRLCNERISYSGRAAPVFNSEAVEDAEICALGYFTTELMRYCFLVLVF